MLPEGWRPLVDPAWLAGWTPAPLAVAGGTLDVVAMGAGAPVLLVPPLPGYKEAWVGIASRLARRFRVVTFDLRRDASGPGAWEALVDDLERVADAFALGRSAVVGHSLGAALTQRWARRRPERLAALVLSRGFASVPGMPGD